MFFFTNASIGGVFESQVDGVAFPYWLFSTNSHEEWLMQQSMNFSLNPLKGVSRIYRNKSFYRSIFISKRRFSKPVLTDNQNQAHDSCSANFFDVDGDSSNGCESGCPALPNAHCILDLEKLVKGLCSRDHYKRIIQTTITQNHVLGIFFWFTWIPSIMAFWSFCKS